MRYATKWVDVEVNLDDFSDEELLEEMRERERSIPTHNA
jgi:hypothetical protein